MSGLFGFIRENQPAAIDRFLAAAAEKMSLRPWHESEVWTAPDAFLGIGRLGIGIFNRAHQPLESETRDCRVWLCGELYQPAELAREMDMPLPDGEERDLRLILAAYRRWGMDFAARLRGAFFVVIYDSARRKIVLANDRFGLYPHYYHLAARQLVFAPQVKGILCAPGVDRKPNLTAASEFFRFQQVLGEKTFHEGIFLFPYGSVAQYDLVNSAWSVRRYWDWDQIPYRPEVNFDEAVQQAGDLLARAVARCSRDIRPAVFLSGGLDSRTILGLAPQQDQPVISATFGQRTSRDVVYAGKVARAAGSRHYWFDLPDGRWVRQNVDLHLALTEGYHSWIHMHGITALADLRQQADCILTGWDGGTIMGHGDHINPVYNQPVDEWTVALRTYQQFTRAYTWPGLTDAEERLLFTPEFGRQAGGRAFESMMSEFSRFWPMRHEYAAEYFYLVNHCCRHTFHMVTTARSTLEVRFPFWDYDLVDFLYSLRPEIRRDQLLYRTLITRRLPRLSLIPYDKQEYLPNVNPAVYSTHKFAVRALKKLRLFPDYPQLYADYENYLRGDLCQWANDILFGPRAQARGLFNLEFVHSLMNRHLARKEDWVLGKIAPLITYEMVLREYFD